jgi:hypothetical protein
MANIIEKENGSGTMQRYIAKELTHFTKQFKTLCDILTEQVLLGGPDIEISRKHSIEFISNYREDISNNSMIEVNKVCFSDIPEGEMGIHKTKFGQFGIAFDKDFIVKKGGVPVHYIPCKAIVNPLLTNKNETIDSLFNKMTKELYGYFDRLICEHFHDDEKKEKYSSFQNFIEWHIKPYFKFFDHLLPDEHLSNYYFEREWRVVGNVKFIMSDIRNILLPQEYESEFREKFPGYNGQINSKIVT